MRRSPISRLTAFVSVVALLSPGALAGWQEVQSIADILSGKKYALTIKPADLPETFKPVRIKTSGSGGGGMMDMFSAMLSPVAMIMGSSQDTQGMALLGLADLSWTQGDVVKMQNKDYLVTYKWNLDLAQLSGNPGADTPEAKSQALKAMELSLTLVAVDGVVTLSPATGFSKADLIKLIETPVQPKEDAGAPPPESVPQLDIPLTSDDEPSDPEGKTLSRVKQAALGVMMYATDWDEVFPYAQSTRAVQYVTYPYMKTIDVWSSANPNKSQILFNMALAGAHMGSFEKTASGTVMLYESKEWPDGGRVVGFADGHVSKLSREEWATVQPTLRLKLPKVGKPLPLKYGTDWRPGG